MNKGIEPYHVVNLSPGRRAMMNALNLAVLFDHDIVDRAPATRFVGRLLELIESGYGLEETNGQ